MTERYSSLFISHGAPTLPISPLPARDFLAELGGRMPRPKAIVTVSPHWLTRGREVKSPARFSTWHDFAGFPDALYDLAYEAPGNAKLRDNVLRLLGEAGAGAVKSDDARLDHGVWVPLLLMYPKADIPVVQVSATWDTPRDYYQLGRALAPLASEGVLLIGSGGFVHNLREIAMDSDQVPDWAQGFADWAAARLEAGDWEALFDYRARAPHPARAHPSEDHWLPLFFAGGAGGNATALHASFAHGGLSMACYGFA
ncbi:MAG: DODA-type extradiol aromatic ring-opening family dioxygenase [Gammaproteobacteria bacterium]